MKRHFSFAYRLFFMRRIRQSLVFHWKFFTAMDLSWKALCVEAVLAAYAYAFLEWLFFATMPSFMDGLSLENKIEIFLITGLVLAAAALSILIPIRLFGWIPGPTKQRHVFQYLAALIPATTAAALSLLLIDNFTYTVVAYGIIKSRGIIRIGYAGLAVALLLFWYRQMLLCAHFPGGRARYPVLAKSASILATALLAISLIAGAVRTATALEIVGEGTIAAQRRPDIILLGGDGTVSRNMSLYGYERDTTPNLTRIAESGLLAENNFTNASHTTGSVFSMLTGKYPAATRLLYAPNILRGDDAVQHLPGILRRAGYTNVQIAFPYYLDAYSVNMQEAFDEVNGLALEGEGFFTIFRRAHWEEVGYFLPRLWERISIRLLHISFIRQMPDPYREVIQAANPDNTTRITDQEKMDRLLYTLRETEGPVFAHVHLMDTHGPRYYPIQRVYSAGMEQDRDWMPEYADDTMLDFDSYVGAFVEELQRLGTWDDTLLIVYSDHVDRRRTGGRIPVLFHFPPGEYAGRNHNKTQNHDIAPPMLAYLGIDPPAWMTGQSLLEGEPPAMRPIISAGVATVDCNGPDWWCAIDADRTHPPFYQFGYIQIVVCQEVNLMDLENIFFYQTDIADHTTPCPAGNLPSPDEGRRLIIEYLRANGFDVSSLE
ncbi:MAG: sulfatase-like hydrolase/transferase [Anaerolineales bacterium]